MFDEVERRIGTSGGAAPCDGNQSGPCRLLEIALPLPTAAVVGFKNHK